VKAIYARLQENKVKEVNINVEKYNKNLAEAEAEFTYSYISNIAIKRK